MALCISVYHPSKYNLHKLFQVVYTCTKMRRRLNYDRYKNNGSEYVNMLYLFGLFITNLENQEQYDAFHKHVL